MAVILVTEMSGAGKSTALAELAQRFDAVVLQQPNRSSLSFAMRIRELQPQQRCRLVGGTWPMRGFPGQHLREPACSRLVLGAF